MPQPKVSHADLRPDAANTGDTQRHTHIRHTDTQRHTRTHTRTHTLQGAPGSPYTYIHIYIYISDTDCVCVYIYIYDCSYKSYI